jgi:hypothetical protein
MLDELDLHVTQMMIFLLPLGAIVGANMPGYYKLIGVGAVLLVPQGRILVRAFWDYPSFNKPKGPYLLVNQSQTLLATLICAAIAVLN